MLQLELSSKYDRLGVKRLIVYWTTEEISYGRRFGQNATDRNNLIMNRISQHILELIGDGTTLIDK